MEKYWFKSNIFAQLSEIVEVLKVYPSSIEITKIKEEKGEKQHGIKRNN